MSRHKLIKNLDLDEELDDFDGEEDDEVSEEDQQQMREGTIKVREALGPDVPITDYQVQESLWHYYYDIEKTVNYLLNSLSAKPTKKAKKEAPKNKGGPCLFLYGDCGLESLGGAMKYESHIERGFENSDLAMPLPPSTGTCPKTFDSKDFFHDVPWLNIPAERRAIFVEPVYPKGGLLGGSSNGTPKMSKLQALAAARKKKAEEQKSSSSGNEVSKPMAEMTLKEKVQERTVKDKSAESQQPRSYAARKRKNSSPHRKPGELVVPVQPEAEVEVKPTPVASGPPVTQARPSAFASVLFGGQDSATQSSNPRLFCLPYVRENVSIELTDAFSGPSPDDVVIAAQSKASGKSGKGPPKTNGEKKADQIASGVEAMKLDNTPRATSKNLNVLAEYEKTKPKNAANFVVIGHVDAGKSTLMGRLLYDLKVVDERTIEKYRKDAEKMGKSSFALAWVLDQGTEERARGVTIDIAMNKFSTDKTDFTILDAPGHRDFIPNMIAGASQADFAVLVIDASTGSFESGLKGQTKEHALLVRSMGVQKVIIAVNKLDTVHWSQGRFEEISQQIGSFLTTAGFLSRNITFIPLSGLNGDNIARRSEEPAADWYTGPTLVEELDNAEPIARALDKPLRLTIGDIFRGGVQNPLSVSGRIEAGSLQTGDALLAQPSGEKAYIKSIEVDDQAADWAVAGQNAVLHLSDIDPIHLKIGDVLCSPSSPIKCVKHFTAKVLAFEFITPMLLDVHRGRLHAPGRIKELVATLDKSTGVITKKKPKIVKPGLVARVVIELDTAVPLEAPSRVVLRSNGETVAAGLLE